MGYSDQNSEREELSSWLTQHETKFYFGKLDDEVRYTKDSLARLEVSGDDLMRGYYFRQGCIAGLERAKELAIDLAKGVEQ